MVQSSMQASRNGTASYLFHPSSSAKISKSFCDTVSASQGSICTSIRPHILVPVSPIQSGAREGACGCCCSNTPIRNQQGRFIIVYGNEENIIRWFPQTCLSDDTNVVYFYMPLSSNFNQFNSPKIINYSFHQNYPKQPLAKPQKQSRS